MPITDIIGIGARKGLVSSVTRWVGTGYPVPAQAPGFQECTKLADLPRGGIELFGKAFTKDFPIEGCEGEIVTEVHVSSDVMALKLVTNKGNECVFGQEGRSEWHVKKADKGECIVGLACAFGRLGGWSQGAKVYSHWALSNVEVVTLEVDEDDDDDDEEEEEEGEDDVLEDVEMEE